MAELFHQHLIVKAWVSNPPKGEAEINAWLVDLVAAIDMEVCIEPRSVYVDTIGNRGLTAQIGLSTSHVAIHVWDEYFPGMLQMDVYSCKAFEAETVLDCIRKFGMLRYEIMMIDRNESFAVTMHRQGVE